MLQEVVKVKFKNVCDELSKFDFSIDETICFTVPCSNILDDVCVKVTKTSCSVFLCKGNATRSFEFESEKVSGLSKLRILSTLSKALIIED